MIVFSIDAAMCEPGIALNESEMEKTREGCDNKLFLGMIFLLCNVVSSFFFFLVSYSLTRLLFLFLSTSDDDDEM